VKLELGATDEDEEGTADEEEEGAGEEEELATELLLLGAALVLVGATVEVAFNSNGAQSSLESDFSALLGS